MHRRVFLTGGSGVLGTALRPLLSAAGYEVIAPGATELDLFAPDAVARAVRGADAIVHLATRIPPPDRMDDASAWTMNDRIRSEATRSLVDGAIAAHAEVVVVPTVTFVYPAAGRVDETTSIPDDGGPFRSALNAEREVARFTEAGRRGVVLRLGLLFGPGTGSRRADLAPYGAVVHVDDAAAALLAALTAPAGIYNVVADGGRVANDRFKAATGWAPLHAATRPN